MRSTKKPARRPWRKRGFFISRCGLERVARRGDLAFSAFQSEKSASCEGHACLLQAAVSDLLNCELMFSGLWVQFTVFRSQQHLFAQFNFKIITQWQHLAFVFDCDLLLNAFMRTKHGNVRDKQS